MIYDVHIFAEVRVKVPGIEANSQTEAIKKAEEQINLYNLFEREHPTPQIEHTEWSERVTNYLVDEDGDTEHQKSTWYDSEYRPM